MRVPAMEEYVTISHFSSHLLPTKDWQTPALFTLSHICSAKCNLNKRGIEVDINYTCELMKHYYERFFRKAIFIVWYLTCSWLWAFRSGELWAVPSGCVAATHTDKRQQVHTKQWHPITNTHHSGPQSECPQLLRYSLCSSVSTVTNLRDKGPTNLGSIFGIKRDSAWRQSVRIFSGNPLSRANAKWGFFLGR